MNCYFFGSFNPVHLGHGEIAKQVKELGGFESVIFVPSFMPPHKVEGLVNYQHRLKMAQLAFGKENVSDIEFRLKVPSYTFQTIEKLYSEQNSKKVNFIIGYDQFFKLESWKNPEILKEKVKFIVIPRKFQNGQVMGEMAFQYFRNKGFDFEVLKIDFLDISSTMIRNLIKNNQDITGLVKYEVKEYIENNGLYKSMAGGKSFL